MTLSIIITSWNTKDLLRACLRSIQKYPPHDLFEIIVVDNNSHDASADMVEKEFPGVQLVRSAINTGYAGGNNIGYSRSAGDYILLLGSDTEVRPGAIDVMLQFLKEQKDVVAVSCKLIMPNGEIQHSCKQFPSVRNALAMYCSLHFLNRKYLMSDFDHNSLREIDQPDATCIMMRREIIGERIFDERYTILYNDVDLCQRIKRNGGKIVFLPNGEVLHHGSQSTKQAPPELRLTMYKNILLYYHSYFGLYARLLLTPVLMIRLFVATRSALAFQLIERQ